jgi:DNA-binding NarL/FixJ family response regulator
MINSVLKSGAIRILTVDDHPILRDGVAALIQLQPDMLLIGEAGNGQSAIEQFRKLRPDITLMDLQMPEVNGVDAIISIRAEFPLARVIVLTTYSGDVQALRALKAGAMGYLLKSSLRKELLDAIRAVHSGRRYLPADISAQIAEHVGEAALTDREISILSLAADGNANKIIAFQLSITEDTVKAHMKNIFTKLNASDRTHAVTVARKRGILDV